MRKTCMVLVIALVGCVHAWFLRSMHTCLTSMELACVVSVRYSAYVVIDDATVVVVVVAFLYFAVVCYVLHINS